MSRMVQIDEWYLQDLADAIRMKTNSTNKMRLPDMAPAIDNIVVGGGGSGEDDPVRQSYVNSTLKSGTVGGNGAVTLTLPKETEQLKIYFMYQHGPLGRVVLENHTAPNFNAIGQYAFAYCTYLESFEWPENLTIIDDQAFRGCTYLSIDKLPDSLTYIGGSAFRDCRELTITEWPANVVKVESSVMRDCPKLQITSLPEGVTSIGTYAFSNSCDSSVSRDMFILPSTIQQINQQAFAYQNFKKIRFMGTPLQSGIHSSAFSYSDVTDIYVPWTHSEVVMNAPWGATNATIHYNTSPDEVIE